MAIAQSIGETFDPLGAHLQNPYPFYEQARREEPVFYSPRMKAWVVTRYHDVDAVLHDDAFSSANAIRTIDAPPEPVVREFLQLGYPQVPGIINTDGDWHRQLRAPYARNFAADRINAAEQVVRKRAEQAVDTFAGQGRAELMRQLVRPLPIAVITHLYGVEEITEEMVTAGTRGFLALQGNLARRDTVEQQLEAVRAFVHLCRVIREVVYRRRANPREGDLVSMFAAAVVPHDQPMTLEQESLVVFNLAGIFLPGHETTRGQLGLGLHHLLTHRDQWELLCRRPELIGQAVEEICRYDTSVPGMFRIATREVTVAGRTFPKDTEFFLAYLSANRDPALCDRPDVFDLTRPPVRHLAFGFGAHYCLGAETGRREIRIALEVLTHRLPGLRLADHPVVIDPIFVTRGPRELHVEW